MKDSNHPKQTSSAALAYPIRKGFDMIGCGHTKGHELINTGQLSTFTIGRFRYVSDEELRRFVREREQLSKLEDKNRSAKAAPAVAARARKRAEKNCT